MYPRSEVFSRSSSYSEVQPEQAEAKLEPGKLHRFTSNKLYVLLLQQIIMVGTEKLTRVPWCKFLDIWFLVHLTINIFMFDFGRLQAKLHFLQKRQDNAVTWCILVLVTMFLNISCMI